MIFFKKFFLVAAFVVLVPTSVSGADLSSLASALQQLQEQSVLQTALDTLTNWSCYCFSKIPEGLFIYYPKQEDVELARQKKLFVPFPFKKEVKVLVDEVLNVLAKQVLRADRWRDKAEMPSLESWNKKGPLVNDYVYLKKFDAGDEIFVAGDIHGSIHSLLRILLDLVASGYLGIDFKIKKPHFYMVFLGDHIDRGSFGLEVLYTLLRLKKDNPETVILLQGNHDDAYGKPLAFEGYHNIESPSYSFTFCQELKNRFLADWSEDVFAPLFARLPLALFVTCNDYVIQMCHGGTMLTFDNDNKFVSFDALDNKWSCTKDTYRCIPDKKMAAMLSWGDFNQTDSIELGLDFIGRTPVGTGVLTQIASKQGINAFIRGHQHANYALKLLPPFTTSENEVPVWWRDVVKDPQKEEDYLKFGFPLKSDAYVPVFTLSTATAFNLSSYEGFGIISLANAFGDCRLHLHERQVLAFKWLAQPPQTAGTMTARLNELKRNSVAYDEVVTYTEKDQPYLYTKVICDTKAKKINVSWDEQPSGDRVLLQ